MIDDRDMFVLVHFTAKSFGRVEPNLASTPSLEYLRRKLLEESLIWLSTWTILDRSILNRWKEPGRGLGATHTHTHTRLRFQLHLSKKSLNHTCGNHAGFSSENKTPSIKSSQKQGSSVAWFLPRVSSATFRPNKCPHTLHSGDSCAVY